MKITLITPTYPDKGISEYADHLIASLQDKIELLNVVSYKKIYPDFLYPVKNDQEYIFPDYKNNVKIRRIISWWNPLSWIRAGMLSNTKIVHYQWVTYFLFLPIFTILVFNKIRFKINIITVHNVFSHEHKKISFIVNKIIFYFCDHFIVHNQKNKQQLINYFKIKSEKILVASIGVNYRSYQIYKKDKARKILNLNQGRKYFLFIGHIRKYKGLDVLLKAFAKISEQHDNVDLIIAGSAWSKWDIYEKIIKDLNIENKIISNIKFLSPEEISLYLSAVDLVVMPYRNFDGSSALLKTVLYFKTPIIASDIEDFRECLDRGSLFQVDSIFDLVKKINDFLELPNFNKKINKNNYDWDATARNHLELYERYSQN